MATIPIEVIVQDKASPEPTPTPSDSGETNIVVPDTGAGTVENGGNGGGIGSAVSIILSAIILVLAIGAMVALLIRRQQGRKNNTNTDIGKKEKLAATASGTIVILAATVLVGNLVIPATKAASDDINTTNNANEGTYIETEDKVTIVATIDKDSKEPTIVNVKDTLYATTNASGYTVTMSMIEEALTSNLYLNGDETSEYYIAPVENARLGDNTWGYRLDEEDEDYLPVPIVDNPAIVAEGEEAVTHEEINVYYTVKANNELPLGTYSGEIEYNMEAKYGFPETLTTMQNMTHEICESVTTPKAFKADGVTIEDNVPTATLTDIRDNKTYTIAKLADGKCWMTQNLDLQKEDLLDGVTLDNTNTDNPASGFELPDSQITAGENWGYTDASIDVKHVYDVDGDGQEYRYCIEYEPWGACKTRGDIIPPEELANLYNWISATAGTGNASLGYQEVATGSICPFGWKMPENNMVENTTDFSVLLYSYGFIASPKDTESHQDENFSKLFKAPFLLSQNNMYVNESAGEAGNMSGYLWTSMSRSLRPRGDNSAYDFAYSKNYINIGDYFFKSYGLSVRCLAR